MGDSFLESLASAVAGAPQDAELRALYAERLAAVDRVDDAIGQALVVLSQQPGHAGATSILARLKGQQQEGSVQGDSSLSAQSVKEEESAEVDWNRLEREIGSTTKPPFVVNEVTDHGVAVSLAEDTSAPIEVEVGRVTLADVGGLETVKQRIRESFLDPMANPEIAKAFKKSLKGGLMLYGPPGCGKTFIAKAIAGELGASFISVTISDILSKWLGDSESNLTKTFEEARSLRPAVLFFDEIDAIGGKRSQQSHQMLRNVVNQLLMEMDGVGSDNEGIYILAATNLPWDVDSGLLRPGRFDRVILVSPPDDAARESILHFNLRDRPLEGIDLGAIVKLTDGFSGADLHHLCETAAEKAMAASMRSGRVEPISMQQMQEALAEVKPSIGPWLESARNVVSYANSDGRYDDLAVYLKARKLL